MVTTGFSKVFKHGKANTLYISVPSMLAQDSVFPFKAGDQVKISIEVEETGPYLTIDLKKEGSKK